MSRARLLRTIILPLLIAGLATAGLYQVMLGRQVKPAAPTVDTVRAVVAAVDIPARSMISADMVALRDLPASYVLAGTVRTLDACIGRVALVPLAAGEAVLSSKLTTQQPGAAGLAFAIASGKRALTMQVDEVIGVAAFPRPGDTVDLLWTFFQQATSSYVTRLLLENLSLLAVVQDMGAGESGAPRELKGYTSLTLEVTPEQAAILVTAEVQGLLRVMLRPALDGVTVGEFDIAGGELTKAVHTLSTNIERRIGFDIRLLEVDAGALAGLGHGTYGTAVTSLSPAETASLLALGDRGQARMIKATTTSTSNRTALSLAYGGEVPNPAGAEGATLSFGLHVQATPSYYGQPTVSVDAKATMRMVDMSFEGAASTALVTAGAVERLASGGTMMIVGLATAEDFAAAAQGKRHVLPIELLSAQLATGERVLVLLITPSF